MLDLILAYRMFVFNMNNISLQLKNNVVFHQLMGYNFSRIYRRNSASAGKDRHEIGGLVMTFTNESAALAELTDMILKAGANLFKATKYLYALTAENYYNCNIKDFFTVILNNIFNADIMSAFHITIDNEQCTAMNTRAYFDVFRLIIYSFAVRLPVLCHDEVKGEFMSAKQVSAVYDAVMEKGVVNHCDAISESFAQIASDVKKGKNIAPYSSEWFRTYIFTMIPELAEINNHNLFFIGAADMLFSLYYICLENEFEKRLKTLVIPETVPSGS
jgi:hypothetical protein